MAYPNAIDAALTKSNGTGTSHTSHVTGMNSFAEEEEDNPVVCKTPTRTLFGNVMAQIRGGHDVVPEDKKEQSERPNAREDLLHLGVPYGLAGLIEYSSADKAFQKDNKYQPESSHNSRQPSGIRDANQLPALLSIKKRNHQTNQSEVKMCDHKNFIIYWDPDDPGNRNGSFIARIDEHEDNSPMVKHQRCKPVDVNKMAEEMAIGIINKFNKEEDERLTGNDRRRKGKEPRRAPPYSVVLLEVHNMYSQLFRNMHSQLVETKEALRVKLDAGERRKELAEKTRLEAQRSRQRGGTSKARSNDNPEGNNKPDTASDSSPSKSKKKTPKEIAQEKVARNKERRGMAEIARIRVEPMDRFKPSTVEEQQARVARIAEQVRRERAAKMQNDSPATKSSRKPKKFAAATNADKHNKTASMRREIKKITRRSARRVLDSDDESSDNGVVKKHKVATKPKSQRMSKADRALLAGIKQAEQEESEKYAQAEAEAPQQAQSEPEPATTIEDSDEDVGFALPEARPAFPHTEVRQEFTIEADELIEKVHQQQEEKEERREAAVEQGKEVLVDESITTVEDEKIDEHTKIAKAEVTAVLVEPLAQETEETVIVGDELKQAPKSSEPAAPRVSKRKSQFSDFEEVHPASSSSPSRPIKKAKQNDFSKEGVRVVEQQRKMSMLPGAAVEAVEGSVVTGDISGNDTQGEHVDISDEEEGGSSIVEQTEESKDDGLDYLFEE